MNNVIIQGSNRPILITFSEGIPNVFEVELYNSKTVKHWDKDSVILDEDHNRVICSLSQEETLSIKSMEVTLEVKWLDNESLTRFVKSFTIPVIKKFDDTIMEEA